jgi:prepilin-type N-terminal cleavage/methylation domain-containing protein
MSFPRADAKVDLNRNQKFRRAFTLIELLVVISIIAVLIALLFPAFQGVQDQAKRTQAKNDLTQIVTAVNAFYTEYGKYPVYYATPPTTPIDADFSNSGAAVVNGGDAFTNMGDNGLVIDILRNNLTATGTNLTWVQNLNPRGIAFLQVPPVKDNSNPRSGVTLAGGALPGTWYDPSGSAYRIRIDTSYNNAIDGPYSTNAGTSAITPNLSIGTVAWSLGKDGAGGSSDKNAGTSDDDVISWQ